MISFEINSIKENFLNSKVDSFLLWLLRFDKRKKIDLIVPVYNFTHELDILLSDLKILETVNRVILVNDHGFEFDFFDRVENYKNLIPHKLLIINNKRNLGFVHAVNNGILASDINSDVLILNSDALISYKTINRLSLIATSTGNVGTVSPLSNSNGFYSFDPFKFLPENKSELIDVDTIQTYLSFLSPSLFEVSPVNNGFCLYIKRELLSKIGVLDSFIFYRGYGEETDFCLRAAELGFSNLVSLTSFGFHSAGFSFGNQKEALKRLNSNRLKSIYPNFIRELASYEKRSIINKLSEQTPSLLQISLRLNPNNKLPLELINNELYMNPELIYFCEPVELIIYLCFKYNIIIDKNAIELFPVLSKIQSCFDLL